MNWLTRRREGRLTQTRSPFSTGPAPAVCFLHRQETVSENGLCLKSTREEPPSLSRCQTTRGHLRARLVSPGRAHLAMLFCSHRLHDGDGGSLTVESECQCRSQLQAPPFPPHPPRLWSFLGRRPRKHPAKSMLSTAGQGARLVRPPLSPPPLPSQGSHR